MKFNTDIPELDALVEEATRSSWTPEMDAILRKYYPGIAVNSNMSASQLLADYFNKNMGKVLTSRQVANHYNNMEK